jgi:transcriptional regulator with XRE-family HTH domain
MIGDTSLPSLATTEAENFHVPAHSMEAAAASLRLREAIRHGGGATAVAKRANVSIGTLNNYLSGRDMKLSFVVAIARACGVSIAWLAAGEGPMRPGDNQAPQEPPTPAPNPQKSALDVLDQDRLKRALIESLTASARHNVVPDADTLARITLIYYAAFTREEEASQKC